MSRRVWAIIIVLALIGVGIFMLSRSAADDNEGPTTSLPLDEATIQFVRPTAIGMLDGERQWELEAERMHEHEGRVYLTAIDPGLLYRDGEPYLSFTAQTGVWHRTSDRLELEGDVRVYRDDEELLRSEVLTWDGRTEILTSPGPVQIHHEGNTIRADRMVGHVKEDELIFQGNVKVTSGRITLSVPGELVYRVEDGSMSGTGNGWMQFTIDRPGTAKKEEEHEA